MSSTIISAHNINRSFTSTEKGSGIKEGFKLFFNPKKTSHEALKNINLEIKEGEFVGLIGANGAGKTTLLKILAGLIPPSSGEARVMGQNPFDRTIEFKKNISLVMGQKAQLWWDLPALDAFDLLKAIYQIPDADFKSRLGELSQILDVERLLKTQIRRLSLGERMKMEVIGALLHWPKIIYLDEPTIGLDVLASHHLRQFLKVFNQKQKSTIILTSHNMDDIEELCTRVMIIQKGEKIYDGSPKSLVNRSENRLRVRLANKTSTADLSALTGLLESKISMDTEDTGEDASDLKTYFFETDKKQIPRILGDLLNKYSVVDMGIEEQSLESVIHKIYQDSNKR
jgi:ABC-2 type transport system ATP-binding protein